jgi:hypothetical protein
MGAAAGAADEQSPSLMAEFVCSAMVVLLLFFVYRWWKQDRIYAMREQERELDLARRPPPVLRRSNSLDGTSMMAGARPARSPPAGSIRRASSSAVLQESSRGNEMRSAVPYERHEKQERLRARAEYLSSLLESPVNDGDSASGLDSPWEWDTGSDPVVMSPMSAYSSSNRLRAAGAPPGYAQRPTGGGSSVSGASRYTAQLLKRRQSGAGGSISPVARTPGASSPISRASSSVSGGPAFERRPSSQLERRQSLEPGGDVHPGSQISRTSSMGSRQPFVPGEATHREGRYETEMVR